MRAFFLSVFALARALQAPPVSLGAQWTRVIALGDVHGDMSALASCLRLAGVVDRKGGWCADPGTLVVAREGRAYIFLSCGDVLDRGADDWRCLTYLRSLRDEARCAGGDVALVLGNHEVLNVLGDVRFVCVEAMHAVANAFDDAQLPKLIARDAEIIGAPRAVRARVAAFQPGGPGALLLDELCDGHPVARVIGDSLFCHGGLHLSALELGSTRDERAAGLRYAEALARLNGEVSAWLRGARDETLAAPVALLPSPSSPVWSRSYSNPAGCEPSKRQCADCHAALRALGCSRMVVGHTPQITTGVNSACEGKVYRIDTGASSYYGGKREALELRDGREPRVLSAAARFDL